MYNVFVLGAPRSGTSFLTKALNLSGWDIGDRAREELTSRTEDGNEGRYEDPYFLRMTVQMYRANEGNRRIYVR